MCQNADDAFWQQPSFDGWQLVHTRFALAQAQNLQRALIPLQRQHLDNGLVCFTGFVDMPKSCLHHDHHPTIIKLKIILKIKKGVGLRRVSYHSSAAFLASAVNSGLFYEVFRYFNHSIDLYNDLVDPLDSLTPDSIDNSCSTFTQKFLSSKIEDCQFKTLFDNSTPIDRARLLSIS